MIEHNDLRLLAGLPIDIEGVGSLHPLRIKEVAHIGEKQYNRYLSALTINSEEVIENLDEAWEYETFDIVVAMCMQDGDFKEIVLAALRLFFCENKIEFVDEMGLFFLGDVTEQRVIHKENYEAIKNTLLLQNYIPLHVKPNFGNERAKELYVRIRRNKKMYSSSQEDGSRLFSVISSISWKSRIGLSVWDLTIYQLFDAYYRLSVVDQYEHTMQGIYAGTIDGQKVRQKELDWSKNIDILGRN